MATFAKDTHATASKAALIGGTTTFIEMCCPSRNEDALEGYNTWKQKAEGNSACDYAFHMAVTRYDEKTEAQLREIVRDGTASFKIFLAYKNFFGVTDEEMFHTLKLAASWA
jgi:dihydropyrimidinase